MTTSHRKYHQGFGFDLWTDRGAWFWQLAGRYCGAGTIGSALTETEALREAYAAVEELSARCAGPAPAQVSSSPGRSDISSTAAGAENSAYKAGHDAGEG